MRRFLVVAAALLFAASAMAASVQIQYTEPTQNVGGGEPALRHTTIYRCFGVTCTDWQPVRTITASATTGGGSVDITVIVPLSQDELPRTVRFAYSATSEAFDTTTITPIPTGNPVEFQ